MLVRKYEELSDLEKLSLINISYSRLNTYSMCPSMYYYSYIQKEERTFGPPAVMGNVIHSVLEDHVGHPLDYRQMIKSMDSYTKEYDPDSLIPADLLAKGRESVGEFYDRHKDETFDVIAKEKEIKIVIGSANIVGYIDLLLKGPNDSIMIVDYKAGAREVPKKGIPQDLQLGLYALAMAHEYPDASIYAELYYLRSGRRKGHWFKTPEYDQTPEVYERIVEAVNQIINDRNFVPTDNSRICSFCDFSANGVCKVGYARMKNRY